MKPDWKDAPEWARYLAMNAEGDWWWFENKPRKNVFGGYERTWDKAKRCYRGRCELCYNPNTSLEKRP